MAVRLKEPPIVEVVCGFLFPSLPIDALLIGKYWAARAKDYPRKALQPALAEQPLILFEGVAPLRGWLIDARDEYVLQLQHDRVYLNWRKRGNAYPHFSGDKGVLRRALEEYDRFSEFSKEDVNAVPIATSIEVQKLDQLEQPTHWKDFEDLGNVLPIVQSLRAVAMTREPLLAVRLNEVRDGCQVHIEIRSGSHPQQFTPTIQLDTRVSRSVSPGDDLQEGFASLNDIANETFFGLLAENALNRFGGPA